MLKKKDSCLIWTCGGETTLIEAYGENGLRVRARLAHEMIDLPNALLPQENQPEPVIRLLDTGKGSITNGKITAIIETSGWRRDQARITFLNQNGQILLQEIDDADSPYARPHEMIPIGGDDFRLTCSFKSNDKEKLYGMGQYQIEKLDLKGCSLELKQQNTQVSVPFVYSSLGYGFLWNNPAVGQATFAANRTFWTAESTQQLDYWICAGDSPAEIHLSYMKVTGFPPMMPEYGLGFWQSKARYWNQEQVLEIAREYKKRNIPLNVLVIDFFHWPYMGDYRFDEEFFPDPKKMVDELKSMGIETMVSVWTPVDYRSENFREMEDNSLLVRVDHGVKITMRFFDGETIYADMTNPETRKYVWNKLRKNYLDSSGIHLFWLDEAEPGYTRYDYEIYRYAAGSALQVGNIYPREYTRMIFEGLKESGREDTLSLVRCAWAGSQRYGALVWSGDVPSTWTAFKIQLCAGQNMAIAGIPWWTTDIGGFHGGNPEDPAFRELLIRWFEWGVFCPVMRLHGARRPDMEHVSKTGRRILGEGQPNEIWSYGEEAEKIFTSAIRLRESMRDYMRDVMKDAHENGAPVIRPLFYDYPDDPECWDRKDEHLLGPDVLVAPVLEPGATERKVYLPTGNQWTLLGTKESYAGGQYITVEAPLDRIPIFLKNGSHSEWHW